MTIASALAKNTYTGTGLVKVYPYTFKITDETHLEVIKADANGNETTLVLTTDYTVSGVGVASGGNVTLVDELEDGYTMSIARVVPLTQSTDLENQGTFYAQTHEDVFDRLTMISQQLQEELDRCPKIAKTTGETADDLAENIADQINTLSSWYTQTLAAVNAYNLVTDLAVDVAAAGATVKTLVISDTQTVSANLNIPANITLDIKHSGKISVNSGKVLTNNAKVLAGRYQIFDGDGTVSLGIQENVYVEWFGVTTSETGANNTTNFNTLMGAITAGQYVTFAFGTYAFTGQPTINKSCFIDGVFLAKADFATNANNQGFLITASVVTINALEIEGPQKAAMDGTQTGIFAYGVVGAYLTDINIINCKVHDFGYGGIRLDFVQNYTIFNNTCSDNYYMGIQNRSTKYGVIDYNKINDIVADGVAGTNAYGIAITKSTGSEATYPIPHDVICTNNIVRGVLTWEGLDTHGGHRLLIADNIVEECRTGLAITTYISTPGSESAPTNCTITGNIVRRLATSGIGDADVQRGILVNGDSASGIFAINNVIDGNTVEDMGTGIEVQYMKNSSVANNTVYTFQLHGIHLYSSTYILIEGNNVSGCSGTAAVAATGTITYTGQPVGTDTITINGKTYTYVAGAPGTDEIQIGGDVDTTITNTTTVLNADTDGRVSGATYTPDTVGDTIEISADIKGQAGNVFTLAESATNVTVSGAYLTGGTLGDPAIMLDYLSASLVYNEGLLINNVVNPGAGYCAIGSDQANSTHIGKNYTTITDSQEYDFYSSFTPQNRVSRIEEVFKTRYTYNPPSIATGSSHTFYVLANGVDAYCSVVVTTDRALQGMTLDAVSFNSGYIAITIYNYTGGAIDLASTNFYINVFKLDT